MTFQLCPDLFKERQAFRNAGSPLFQIIFTVFCFYIRGRHIYFIHDRIPVASSDTGISAQSFHYMKLCPAGVFRVLSFISAHGVGDSLQHIAAFRTGLSFFFGSVRFRKFIMIVSFIIPVGSVFRDIGNSGYSVKGLAFFNCFRVILRIAFRVFLNTFQRVI